MANETLGLARCDCGSEKAKVKLAEKTGLAYLHCSACSLQIFARSARSDEALRKRIIGAGGGDPAPAPKPAGDPQPPKSEPKRDSWDPYA